MGAIRSWHIEKLHTLDALPRHGVTGACCPVQMHPAAAGWMRAVAIMDRRAGSTHHSAMAQPPIAAMLLSDVCAYTPTWACGKEQQDEER